MVSITDVRFEHYDAPFTLGVDEAKPRLSWKIQDAHPQFRQSAYEVEVFEETHNSKTFTLHLTKVTSTCSTLVPWPSDKPLRSRQKILVRVRVWDYSGIATPWSKLARLEAGLLYRTDWHCGRVTAPWGRGIAGPVPEQLFRKEFLLTEAGTKARLYITAQGVYEAYINGQRIGDYFLAPGWTSYEGRLQYQTYDVTSMLKPNNNCLGVRVAEGWFSGRIGFEGGHRHIWGLDTALLAQMEITYGDGRTQTICSDSSWTVSEGPIRLAEIYDGEKYDATQEIPNWSSCGTEGALQDAAWKTVLCLPPLPDSTQLTAGYGGPVRRIETIEPVDQTISPSGKVILDFGQNLVGYLRLKDIKGHRGHKIRLAHAEVLQDGELCTRPLRVCKAIDEYTLKGAEGEEGETYEPRFTFHGFR
jgi:alpha-L-rhamnosidase